MPLQVGLWQLSEKSYPWRAGESGDLWMDTAFGLKCWESYHIRRESADVQVPRESGSWSSFTLASGVTGHRL